MNLKEVVHNILYPRPVTRPMAAIGREEPVATTVLQYVNIAALAKTAQSVRPVERDTTAHLMVVKPQKYLYRSKWTRVSAIELVNGAIAKVKARHGSNKVPRFVYLSVEQFDWYQQRTGQTKFSIGSTAVAIRSDYEQPCNLANNEAFVVGVQEVAEQHVQTPTS